MKPCRHLDPPDLDSEELPHWVLRAALYEHRWLRDRGGTGDFFRRHETMEVPIIEEYNKDTCSPYYPRTQQRIWKAHQAALIQGKQPNYENN